MQTAIYIIEVVILCGICFTWGFFIGKGKIEIKRKLTEEEKKQLEKIEKIQQEAYEKYNKTVSDILYYNDLGGDE